MRITPVFLVIILACGSIFAIDPGPNDISGDGRSDFTVLRNDGGPSLADRIVGEENGRAVFAERPTQGDAPQANRVTWYSATSNEVPYSTYLHGLDTTDTFIMADMVGDNKADLVAWRPGLNGNAGFYIFDTSNGTALFASFGTTGDNPTMVNDFNGDGKIDLAVYREGVQSVFFWAPVSNPANFTQIPWGRPQDVPFTLDYDGDNHADVAIQRASGGAGQYWIRRSSDGGTEVINGYGLPTDFIVPGDYDGDGRDDICASRVINTPNGPFMYFFPRSSATGNVTFIQWGLSGDVRTPGDYDGDGKMDVAVWRPGAPGANGTFYVMKSTGGTQTFVWGKNGDIPVANWNVH